MSHLNCIALAGFLRFNHVATLPQSNQKRKLKVKGAHYPTLKEVGIKTLQVLILDDPKLDALQIAAALGIPMPKKSVDAAMESHRKTTEQGHIKAKAENGGAKTQKSNSNNVPSIKPQASEQIESFFDKNLNQLEKNILAKIIDGIKILLWIILILFIIYAVINFIDHVVFDSGITGGPYDDGRNSMN